MTAAASIDVLPLGPAIVLGALVWALGRVVVALIDARTVPRACRVDEVLHHVDAVKVAVGDAGAQVRDEVCRLREVVEQPGPRGGAR
jgi:hypothetical protein